jgi:hypothetical protein
MRPLFVNPIFPQKIQVLDSKLVVESRDSAVEFDMFKPKHDYDAIMVHGTAGYFSLAALDELT